MVSRERPCSSPAVLAKSTAGGDMHFSPLRLTPLIGVFDMPRAIAFYLGNGTIYPISRANPEWVR
jgi:hypothetical protein